MLRLDDEASSSLEASAAAGLSPPPMAAFAVALKLPDFWLHDPPSWFVHVEAQFALRGVSADDTKYHHVVASLDPLSTRRVMTLLRDPPAQGKYTTLKALLLRRYSLSDAERAEKLLSLAGLGDGTALELFESMLSLLGADDGGFLFTHLFLRQLPAPVRAGLANSPLLATKDYRSLAEEADRILLATRTFGVQAIVQDSPACSPATSPMLQGPSDSSTVAARCTAAPQKGALFLSPAFWSKGTALSPALQFPDPGKRACQRSVAAATAGNKERLVFLEDSRSGRRFLVDSGSQKSLLPPAGSDRLAEGCGPLLTAANGSPIKTFGERLVTVCFHDRDFQWNFVVAASSVPIIGADFLCAHGLLVDVANRRLIDAVSFSSLPCLTRGAQPVVHANSVDSGDVFQCLLSEFPSLSVPTFSSTVTKHGVEHYITTVGPPVCARRLDPAKLAVAREEFATMERLGIVQRSNSAWASPLRMVPKSDGRWRPCGDFRRLNNVTENDHYPIPHIQDFSAHLAGTSVFSKIDLLRGYHQVPVHAEDVPKTAVITPFGLFEFLRMPFGLKGAAQTFQRLMDSVARGLPFVFVYLDDILVASSSKEQHMFHLRQVFQRLGAVPLPDKVRAVSEFPRPTNVKALQEFLGMVNFYNRFLPRAAHLLKPLYGALKGKKANDSVDWFPESIQAFSDAKSALANAALLAHPSPSAPIALTTDASDIAVGAVLEQRISGVWQPLAFFSRTLRDSERNYSVFDRELLALHLATRHFRFFLEGRHFTAYMDHKPLTFAMSKVSDPWSARQQRQLAAISEFTTGIRHMTTPPWLPIRAITRTSSPQTGLILEDRPVQDGGPLLVCDVSTGRPRPVVPASWRRQVFDSVHALSHPGVRASVKLVSSKFVWPGLRKSVKEWASACIPCQRAKVHKHTKAPLEPFFIPGKRFDHVHVDLVGPLPQSHGFTHGLTVVDRTTRWPEAVPLASTTAAVVAKAFLSSWVSRFGPPADITSDRGPQFISELWSAMADGLGAKVHRTTAYNIRSLKAAFRASLKDGNWVDLLPWVLLGLRSAVKEDLGASPAELVFGQPLRVPGEFLPENPPPCFDPSVLSLNPLLHSLRVPGPVHHCVPDTFVPKTLETAKFVFVRHDAHRTPLRPLYDGPFRVIEPGQKHFVLDFGGRRETVCVDRLKLAHVLPDSNVVPAQAPRRGRPPSMGLTDSGFPPRTTPGPPAFEPPPAFPARLHQPRSQDGPSSACSLPPRFSRSGRLLRPRVLD
ncbi:LOW QUALITY PROTEIN: uncharacterized protein K02A2.6 [Maylandia zebra]|uniref:LOW QUALITY PROTEIN: uncharacterized protein K02A2.6 n=1 Tax=Maylandia zebra TaxID=106582 RepID=UPI00403C7F07